MRKFILNSFIFIFPFIIIAFIFEFLLRNIPNDYSYKKTYLDKNSNKIERLFLGSSHAYYGINPIYINGNSFNASHISQTINFDFEILKKYKNDWDSLEYIIIPIDYFTFFSRTEVGTESWRIKNYNIYYNLKKTLNIFDYSELLSINFKKNLDRINNFYFLNKSNITCSELGFGNDNILNKDLIITGEIAANRHTKKDLSFYEKNLEVLNSFVKFSKKRDINLIFYSTPAFESYVSNLDEKQLNLTLNTINELVKKHNNCVYINLLNDNTFKSKDFRDADHLNQLGAKKLSIKLNDIINSMVNTNKN